MNNGWSGASGGRTRIKGYDTCTRAHMHEASLWKVTKCNPKIKSNNNIDRNVDEEKLHGETVLVQNYNWRKLNKYTKTGGKMEF